MPVPSNYFTLFCIATCEKIEVKLLTDRQLLILASYKGSSVYSFILSVKFVTSLLFLLVCPNLMTHICFYLPSYELNLVKVKNNKKCTTVNCLNMMVALLNKEQ